VFLPLDVLGLAGSGSVKPGLLKSTSAFDAMTKAPQNGYVTSDTILIAEQDRFFLRTGVNTCTVLGVPLYAKLEILDLDTATASVTMRVIANENCGYRGLGLLYARRGDSKRAADAYNRYLRMAPGARDAGQIRERLGKLQGD
jgi:hypothetical protein